MNTKTAITGLSTRFDAFEERLAQLGGDLSTITALFYNYIGNSQPQFYVNTLGWKPIYVSGWRPGDMEELALASVRAWSSTFNSTLDDRKGYNDEQKKEKPPQ